jgi:hypothetical protein
VVLTGHLGHCLRRSYPLRVPRLVPEVAGMGLCIGTVNRGLVQLNG